MEFRHLGKSGLKVSAVSYGNWITQAMQRLLDASCHRRRWLASIPCSVVSSRLTVPWWVRPPLNSGCADP